VRRRLSRIFQADSKSSQIQQNPAKLGQNLSKEKALISFDSLVHFEPFQGVALTPRAFFSLPAIVGNRSELKRVMFADRRSMIVE
jgi:hypothetical protein